MRSTRIRELQGSIYESQDRGTPQRIFLAVGAGLCVALAWWLLFAGGLPTVGNWLHLAWYPGDHFRRACLAAAFSIYYVRLLFTEFAFLRRGVSWSEVFSVAPWLLFVFLLLAITGGRNSSPFGALGITGIVLFIGGFG
jgi:hypothetical protein